MWAARLDPALHTPHGLVFCKSLLGPQEPSRKTYPTPKMLIFNEKGRFLLMFSTTFLNNQSFSTIAAYAVM